MNTSNKKGLIPVVKEFMAINWWIVWVVQVIAAVVVIWVSLNANQKFEQAAQMLQDRSRSVVMLDQQGRPVYQEKSILTPDAPEFQLAIKNIVSHYAITDWQRLSNGFRNKIRNVEEMKKLNPSLAEFEEEYFSKQLPAGLKGYDVFLKTLLHLMNTDELPEKINILGSRISDYSVRDSHFSMTVVFNIAASIYLIEKDRTVDKQGTIEIKVGGYFEPRYGGTLNPLGLFFDDFSSTFLKKR